jgi:hypothetical protein
MENSRDSSIWRSLAVAFGDGVAFGVGMKLTQNAARQAGVPRTAEVSSPYADRIGEIEQRIARIEQAPAALPAPSAAPPSPGSTFDQKVLEAVVNALDARLQEHAVQVERRLAELEARIAIELKTLDQQDRSIANGLQTRLEDVQGSLNEQTAGLRGNLDDMKAALGRQASELNLGMAGMHGEMATLHQEVAGAITRMVTEQTAALRESVKDEVGTLRGEMDALQQEVAAAVTRMVTEQIAALRESVKEDVGTVHGEIAALQHETAQTMARLVAEQVTSQVDDRATAFELSLQGRVAGTVEDALQAQLRPLETQLREEIREAASRVSSLVASAVDATVEEKVSPLRNEVEEKTREVVELRERMQDSDRTVVDLIMSIGDTCRKVAGRIANPAPGVPEPAAAAPEPAVEPTRPPEPELPPAAQFSQVDPVAPLAAPEPTVPIVEPPPEASSGLKVFPAEAPPLDVLSAPAPPPEGASSPIAAEAPGLSSSPPGPDLNVLMGPSIEPPIPGFAQPPQTPKLWRIPLVSSFLITTGGLLIMHYLQGSF